ncbi:hypothetical protein CARUB_v10024434mg [Capsella rubella]|uniref:Uncharacterized protein n=1 Tax=Capsella rubella TaxID=81985 RepID=R0FZI6_9BRAS|nr:uncharacterized protein LOC17889041 [Capsella rubella]EOA28241.1 hypothetical protein CARUB_v10024434mg [Capsella rubella]
MEGLIPLVYKAVMQIRYGNESSSQQLSSSYYVRLPGDSGRFARSDVDVSGFGSSSDTNSSSKTTTCAVYTGVQSPVSRQVIT